MLKQAEPIQHTLSQACDEIVNSKIYLNGLEMHLGMPFRKITSNSLLFIGFRKYYNSPLKSLVFENTSVNINIR